MFRNILDFQVSPMVVHWDHLWSVASAQIALWKIADWAVQILKSQIVLGFPNPRLASQYLLQWNPFKGHPWNEDTSLNRSLNHVPASCNMSVLFTPWSEDTSLIRTHFRGPIILLWGFHCIKLINVTHAQSLLHSKLQTVCLTHF